jgi:hypothetical protein
MQPVLASRGDDEIEAMLREDIGECCADAGRGAGNQYGPGMWS